jgi:hypothetical protein
MEVFCPVLEFWEEKRTFVKVKGDNFVKVKGGNMNFFKKKTNPNKIDRGPSSIPMWPELKTINKIDCGPSSIPKLKSRSHWGKKSTRMLNDRILYLARISIYSIISPFWHAEVHMDLRNDNDYMIGHFLFSTRTLPNGSMFHLIALDRLSFSKESTLSFQIINCFKLFSVHSFYYTSRYNNISRYITKWMKKIKTTYNLEWRKYKKNMGSIIIEKRNNYLIIITVYTEIQIVWGLI